MGIAKNLFILALMAAVAVIACQSSKNMAKQAQSIDFENIAEARSFNVPQSGTTVIKSQKEWEVWWENYWNSYSEKKKKTPPPYIDFKNKMIIAVHWGEGFSGCSNLVNAIERIEKTEDSLMVVVGELPTLGPCDMLVYPLQIVKVPVMDLPVAFSGEVPAKE